MDEIVSKVAIMLVPALLAIILHEVAHGYIAEQFGDPTARLLGRLTLNPLKHLDPIGTIAIFVFGFGWARPVPVNPGNFRRPRRDMIWVALAGPTTNFILAALSALLLHGVGALDGSSLAGSQFYTLVTVPLKMMAGFSLYINALLGIFNLIPVPPLDGGKVLIGLLPEKPAASLSRFEPFGFALILFLVFFTDIWSKILGPIIKFLVVLLSGSQAHVVEQSIRFLFGQ